MPRDDCGYGNFSGKVNCGYCRFINPCPPRPCPYPQVGPAGPQGERGPTGPQGERGATGPQGERGLAGPPGQQGLAGPQGQRGLAGPQGERGLAGPQGERGASGLRGEAGFTGPQGTCIRMLGSYAGMEAFLRAHPTGSAGDTYLVAGRLVTWDEATNAWNDLGSLIGPAGTNGERGDRGPIAATIPFSIASTTYGQGATISSDAQGAPENVHFSGFGNSSMSDSVRLQPGEWETGIITITEGTTYPSTFIMPFDGTLRNVNVVFTNRTPLYLAEGVVMRPFVCLATCDCQSLEFSINLVTMTYAEPFIGTGEEIPKYSLKVGSLSGLDVAIARGTLVGIVAGWVGEGEERAQTATVSLSGGLFVE